MTRERKIALVMFLTSLISTVSWQRHDHNIIDLVVSLSYLLAGALWWRRLS